MTSNTIYKPNTTQTIDGYSWYIETSGADYSIETIGANTIRFQVNAGDVWSAIDPATKNRSELASRTNIANGTPINVSYVMNIEPGSVNSSQWMVLGQFHQNDYAGAPALSPPFAINMNGQYMAITIGYTGANGQAVYMTLYQDANPIVLGKDYAFNISVTFDPNGNGHLVVTRNGVTLVNYTGQLGFTSSSSVYWKEGIYESASTTTMAVDYSNLSLTTTTPATQQTWNGVQTFSQYDSAGNVVSTTTNQYDASGILDVSTVRLPSGARTVSTYNIAGQAYTSMVQQFNASGVLTGLTEKHADGSLAYVLQTSATGVVTKSTYGASGLLIETAVVAIDGSSTVYDYDAKGASVIDTRTFNSAGHLLTNYVRNADGSKTYTVYGGAKLALQSYSVTSAAGVVTLAENFDANGSLILKKVVNADGSYVLSRFAVTGQAYTSSVQSISATGVTLGLSEYYSNGNLYYSQALDSNGAIEYRQYASNRILTSWAIQYTDGSKSVTKYDANGLMTVKQTYSTTSVLLTSNTYNADGSYQIAKYAITGKNYVSDIASYSAARVLTAETHYQANGAKLDSYTLSSTGVATTNYYDGGGALQERVITQPASASGGASVSGATNVQLFATGLTVNASGLGESFTSYHNDTFAFSSGFGADVITGFNAGSGATHDLIELSKALIPSFAQLNMVQSGANTIIQVDATDTITLKGVAVSSLTASNFLFH